MTQQISDTSVPEILRFGYGETEPVHTGIDVDGGAAVPARTPAKHVPFGKLVKVADHRLAVDFGIGLAGVLDEIVSARNSN